MFCPRCNQSVAYGDVRCRGCGVPFTWPTPPPSSIRPRKRSKVLAVTGIGLALAAAAYCIGTGTGITTSRGSSPLAGVLGQHGSPAESTMAEAPGAAAPAVLAANEQGAPATTLASFHPDAPPTLETRSEPAPSTMQEGTAAMPDEVRAWLSHLERIEAERKELSGSEVGEALGTMASLQANGGTRDMSGLLEGDEDAIPDARSSRAGEVRDKTNTMRVAWTALTGRFLAVAPPAECASLRDSYRTALTETGAMMVEIANALERSSEDHDGALKALTAMQGRSESRVGRPMRESDSQVGAICRKYGVDKWFSIKDDAGGVMGMLR